MRKASRFGAWKILRQKKGSEHETEEDDALEFPALRRHGVHSGLINGFPAEFIHFRCVEGTGRKTAHAACVQTLIIVPGPLVGYYCFHAGSRIREDGRMVTNGGRVLGVTAKGATLQEARTRAYEAAQWVHRRIVLKLQLHLIQGAVNAGVQHIHNVVLHSAQHHLGLWVAEPGIVLQHLGTVLREHETEEDDALEFPALRRHGVHGIRRPMRKASRFGAWKILRQKKGITASTQAAGSGRTTFP